MSETTDPLARRVQHVKECDAYDAPHMGGQFLLLSLENLAEGDSMPLDTTGLSYCTTFSNGTMRRILVQLSLAHSEKDKPNTVKLYEVTASVPLKDLEQASQPTFTVSQLVAVLTINTLGAHYPSITARLLSLPKPNVALVERIIRALTAADKSSSAFGRQDAPEENSGGTEA